MNILAVTCYTGGEELALMTADCLSGLSECVPEGVEMKTSVLAQGTHAVPAWPMATITFSPRNIGFAYGMNLAIENGLEDGFEPDYVLCFNNDLQFPNKDWLAKLVEIADVAFDQVLCPATDSAAHRIQSGPEDKPSYPVENNSAYAWLIPFKFCQFLMANHGFWLFSEDFRPAYGEDDWTAFLIAKEFGPKAMRYVPRSFVKHLRGRTARTVEHDRARSSRTLVEKLRAELKDPDLRTDLRRWAQNYISILSTKLK